MSARVTGHLKLVERRDGAVWYATHVPGRKPEQTTGRLSPAHLTGGKPRTGHLARRQAEDALADTLADERRKVAERSYEQQPDGATFADAAGGFLRSAADEQDETPGAPTAASRGRRKRRSPGRCAASRAFPLSDVQAMLGHAHITTTMHYVHHRPGADDAAPVERVRRRIRVPARVRKRGHRAQLSATQRHEHLQTNG